LPAIGLKEFAIIETQEYRHNINNDVISKKYDIEFSGSGINAIVTNSCYGLRFLQKRL